MAKLTLSIGEKNEVLVNNGKLSVSDKIYVCDCCGDLLQEELHHEEDKDIYTCNLCHSDVIPKCSNCAYLIKGEGDTYHCDKFDKPCVDVAYKCEIEGE